MKVFLAESGNADNYMLVETADGLLCSNCAPDGCWAGIEIGNVGGDGCRADLEALARRLYDATDPDLSWADLDWMGDPCYSSMEEWEAEQETFPEWARDTLHFVGEFPQFPRIQLFSAE